VCWDDTGRSVLQPNSSSMPVDLNSAGACQAASLRRSIGSAILFITSDQHSWTAKKQAAQKPASKEKRLPTRGANLNNSPRANSLKRLHLKTRPTREPGQAPRRFEHFSFQSTQFACYSLQTEHCDRQSHPTSNFNIQNSSSCA
jgi:hypothetical protein